MPTSRSGNSGRITCALTKNVCKRLQPITARGTSSPPTISRTTQVIVSEVILDTLRELKFELSKVGCQASPRIACYSEKTREVAGRFPRNLRLFRNQQARRPLAPRLTSSADGGGGVLHGLRDVLCVAGIVTILRHHQNQRGRRNSSFVKYGSGPSRHCSRPVRRRITRSRLAGFCATRLETHPNCGPIPSFRQPSDIAGKAAFAGLSAATPRSFLSRLRRTAAEAGRAPSDEL